MGNFKFGEHSTKDFDLVIQAPPTYNFPEKDVSVEHIPGRNGDLIIDNNCWKNTERTYSIASVFRPGTDFISNSERLIKWLTSKEGYHRLEDSYDPDVYRLGSFKNSGSLTNYYDKATAINVTFDCKPQRYLKNGEKSVEFSGSVATLENPTGYQALPEITIKNILPLDNEVLLCTIQNESKVTSVVSLNKIRSAKNPYDVVLNSELQTVYSPQQEDINLYVNLNDLEFPTLRKGYSIISINNYIENKGIIEQYNNLINNKVVNDNVCLAKYRPFDSTVESKQDSIYIMSFDLLKQKTQQVYEMKAYANYCLDKAEQYTFTSFNTILSMYSQVFSFRGDYSNFPGWLNISGSGDNIEIRAGDLDHLGDYNKHYGYFITTDTGGESDKKIIRVSSGEVIVSGVKESSTITVTFYPAYTDELFSEDKTYYIGDIIDYNNELYKFIDEKQPGQWDSTKVEKINYAEPGGLEVNYNDQNIPEWLGFKIDYDESKDGHHSPKTITFLHTKTGFYYLPKSGLFGKATWKLYEENDKNKDLNSLTWSTWKKAFMPSGVSTSTTVGYTYYFLPKPYKPDSDPDKHQEYLQYEPVYQNELNEDGSIKTDANGNPITKIVNDVYFKIEPLATSDSAIGSIRLIAKKSGYFRFNDSEQFNGWFTGTKDKQLSGPGVSSSVNSSNIIYFSENIPDYNIIDNWPEWLNPVPELDDSGIKSETLGFNVLKSGWYQYTYIDPVTKNSVKSLWTYISENNRLGELKDEVFTPYNAPHDESFSVYMLEGESTGFPVKEYSYTDPNGVTIKNIAFVKIKPDGSEEEYRENNPPSWLKVLITQGVKEDYSDWILNFYPNSSGLYKWDTKSVWNFKTPTLEEGKELVSSTGTDDTSIYYMDSIPEYPIKGSIFDYCRIEINENYETGNPESISIYAKIAGYYRAKNNSSWKYYNINDKICDSKVSETSEIYYLTTSERSLDNIEILVIPRWWSL